MRFGWRASLAVVAAVACRGEPPRGGSDVAVRWAVQVDYPQGTAVLDAGFWVGVDAAGHRYLLTTSGQMAPYNGEYTVGLRRFDRDGAAVGNTSWTYPGASTSYDGTYSLRLAIAPSGDALITASASCAGPTCGRIDFGGGPIEGSALVRLDPDGRFIWQRTLGGEPLSIAVDDHGAATVASWALSDVTTVQRIAADGSLVWSRGMSADRCASDEGGDAICAWTELPQDRSATSTAPATLHVTKLAAGDGAVVWTRAIPGPIWASAVDARGGTIAVLASRGWGPLAFGASTLPDEPPGASGKSVLLVLDSDGPPRWAAASDLWFWRTARVGTSGRLFVAGQPEAGASDFRVDAFSPAGDLLWATASATALPACLPDGGCGAVLRDMAAGPGGDLTVAGSFSGGIDVGGAVLKVDGVGALVEVLAPNASRAE